MFGQKPYIQYLGDDLNLIEKELPKINSHFLLLTALLFQNFTSPNTSCMAITSDHYNSINANQPSKTVQNNAIPCITNVVWNHFRQKGFNCFTFKKFSRISLLDLDLEAFLFHFSLLEKSEPDLDFTFHFSVKVKKIFFHFQFSKRVKLIFISLFTSRSEWKRFLFHFSLLEIPISTLAGHCWTGTLFGSSSWFRTSRWPMSRLLPMWLFLWLMSHQSGRWPRATLRGGIAVTAGINQTKEDA